jgi:hypothetical protein
MKNFKEDEKQNILSGAIKFSTDYVSKQQIYEAVVKWSEEDSNVKYVALRLGGTDQFAMDFRYELQDGEIKTTEMRKQIVEYFENNLQSGVVVGWDLSSPTIVIK